MPRDIAFGKAGPLTSSDQATLVRLSLKSCKAVDTRTTPNSKRRVSFRIIHLSQSEHYLSSHAHLPQYQPT